MSSSKKVQCWLCGGWQDRKYTKVLDFNGMDEIVCIKCASSIRRREESMESILEEDEAYESEENPFQKAPKDDKTSESDGAD